MRFDEEPHSHSGRNVGHSSLALPGDQRRDHRASLLAMMRLALMRMARRPWLLAVLAVGVIAIDVVACTVPLYLRLIATTQLQTTIAQAPASSRNVQISAYSNVNAQALHARITEQVEAQAAQNLAGVSVGQPLTYMVSDHVTLKQAGAYNYEWPNEPQWTQFDVFDYGAALPHMRLIAGELPPSSPAPAGQPAPVLITQEMANAYNVQVGQRISMVHYNGFPTFLTTTDKQTTFSARVTGIWTPRDINDPFWNGLSFASVPYIIKYAHQAYPPPLWPLLTTQANFYATLTQFPQMSMSQNWVYYTDPTRITTSNSAAIADNITTLRTHLNQTLASGNPGDAANTVHVETTGRLDQLIADVQQQLNLLALPLYMIAIQIVALALLFVAAMARLLVTAQEQEIVTLKSRGASGPQLLGVLSAQGVPPGVLAAVAGPLLAVGISLLLVRAFLPGSMADLSSITNITGGAGVTSLASLSQSVAHVFPLITPALVGSVVGIGVVIAAGFGVARLDVLAFRRELARPVSIPFWRRYYLDLGLVVLCVVGYLELSQFGNTQTRLQLAAVNAANAQTQVQSSGASLLLLVAPALLLLAGGLLILRLVPLVARLGARLAERGRGLAGLLALARIARTPTRYTRMILLLALAVGLGLFALTFDASLTQNTLDRTAYATGADIRLTTTPTVGEQEASAYSASLRQRSGVAAVSGVYRTNGSALVDGGLQGIEMLGVNPDGFAAVASTSWRSDYAAQSLPDLMARLGAHESGMDAGSQAHPMWAIVSQPLAHQMRLKVGDGFQAILSDISYTSTSFVVGAIISEFPTLYPNSAPGGFMVLDVHDLDGAISAHALANNSLPGGVAGVNEFWLRTAGDLASDRALLQTLKSHAANFSLTATLSLREELARAAANPVNGGMRGLLLLGALVAALLAVVGSVAQSVLAARQRTRQFAVLRTLGMGARQLVGTLLSEQMMVYLFGLLGGTLLGLILLTATIPYLQFSDTLVDPTTVGVPGYFLRINWLTTGAFYGALVAAFVLALIITARFAATLGLGKTLRIGED